MFSNSSSKCFLNVLLTICGIAIAINPMRLPKRLAMHSKIGIPKTLPNATEETNHDICSAVKGPLSSGDLSDVNVMSAGDTQPTILPWLIVIKLTAHEKVVF